jgi:parallel beta-helix repeat protein
VLQLSWNRKEILSALGAVLMIGALQPARGATLCVNPGGTAGCETTIGAAVDKAASGDTIQVAAGTYKEDVTITKALSLIGAGSSSTIIDATGLANGIVVTSTAVNVSGAVISGFTIENANFQGILLENVSSVTVWNNQVLNNNKNLDTSNDSLACPGLPPAFQMGEADDCGEGIHLTGVDHSVISNNVVQNNAGGILVTDDTGPTHDNLISGNLVSNNPYDCGITLAAHGMTGIYQNTISGNQVLNNGTKPPGEGAGVGIFAPGPGSKAYANVIINNTIKDNGLPGVTMHNHASVPGAPPVDFDDNVILGNIISGNAADTDDAATPGTAGINIFSRAPMHGTIVSQNVISQETIAFAFNAPGESTASLNNLMAPTGVANLGTGTVNATQNWWGCITGANTVGCGLTSGSGITSTAWLTTPFNSAQLPKPVAPPPPSGGGNPITILVTGPAGATSASDTFVAVANQITLNASQSTSANTGALTYAWTPLPGFPAVAVLGGNTAKPTFQLSSHGLYQVTLTVTDATGTKATATITVQYF